MHRSTIKSELDRSPGLVTRLLSDVSFQSADNLVDGLTRYQEERVMGWVQYSTVQYSTVHPSIVFTLMNLLRHHEHVSELATAWSPAMCAPPTCSTGGRGER